MILNLENLRKHIHDCSIGNLAIFIPINLLGRISVAVVQEYKSRVFHIHLHQSTRVTHHHCRIISNILYISHILLCLCIVESFLHGWPFNDFYSLSELDR